MAFNRGHKDIQKMKEKVFVTGGAGFIGSHIVEDLLKNGYEVTIYDNFSSGRRGNLNSIKDDVRIIKGDILDYDKLKRAMKGHRYVSHQAAQLEIFRCLDDPFVDLNINTIGTLNVLKACLANNVEKIINASSACVYGQAQYVPQDEDHPTNPNWPYGISKLAGEKYANIYHERYSINVMNLRYSIVYGEREWLGRVLTMFLKRILENRPPVIFGRGDQLRDFIYVKDVVRLHNLLLKNNIYGCKTYNVSTGIGSSIKELAKMVIEIAGMGIEPIFEEVKEGELSHFMSQRKRIPAELIKMVLSPEKAGKETGWIAETSLKEGIVKEFNWIRENSRFWKMDELIKV